MSFIYHLCITIISDAGNSTMQDRNARQEFKYILPDNVALLSDSPK